MDFPRMFPLRQVFRSECLDDPVAEVRQAVMASGIGSRVVGGKRVAVTAGSRGIGRIAEITRTVVECVRDLGGDPFILPAMGSHGGARADGQCGVADGAPSGRRRTSQPEISSLDRRLKR